MRDHIHVRIHAFYDSGRGRRLGLLHIRRSEQKLSIQIGLLDQVHISHRDITIFRAHADHRKIFQQLATDRAGTYHKVFQIAELTLEFFAKNSHLKEKHSGINNYRAIKINV